MNRFLDFIIGVPLVRLLSLFSKRNGSPRPLKKVLIIKLAAAGDTILLGSVLTSYRTAHPDVEIHWLVSNINEAIARAYTSADRFLVWSRKLTSLGSLLAQLRAEHYDAVCDLEQWSRGTALISFFSGGPQRYGFRTKGQYRDSLYTQTFEKKYDQHEINDFIGLMDLMAPLTRNVSLDLPLVPQGITDAQKMVPHLFHRQKGDFYVLVHPGCGWDGTPREWPLSNYAVIAHWLIKNHNAKIILSSGPEETIKTKQLNRLLGNKGIDLGGKLSWMGLSALVERVDLVISGNTGVMHVAAAHRKKQVALHGPTNPLLWGPLNDHALVVQSSCPKCPCLKLGFEYHAKDQSCMAQLPIDDVKAAVSHLIDINRTI